MPVIAVKDIAEVLGREYTDAQIAVITRKIDSLRDELERTVLHATVERRERTDLVEASLFGRVHLLGPIIRVIQVHGIGDQTDSTFTRSSDPKMPDVIYPSGATVGKVYEVTYEAGYSEVDSAVYDLIWDAVTSQQVVGVAVASGAYSSINVEGASIGLGGRFTGNNANQKGTWSQNELSKVRHLKRMVVA